MGRSSRVAPFGEAVAVTKVAPNTYRARLHENFCIGTVPNGGYVASTMLNTASQHLAARNQPDVISAHFEYPDRTEAADALVVIKDVKLGRSFSTLHATLYQGDIDYDSPAPAPSPKSRTVVLAYFTLTNMSLEKGVSLETGWELYPPPAPVDLTKLGSRNDGDAAGSNGNDKDKAQDTSADPAWTSISPRMGKRLRSSFVRASHQLQMYSPRTPGRKGLEDVWMRLASGERFTNASLGFVADAMPYVVEAWKPPLGEGGGEGRLDGNETYWYPTLALNLDIKKALPEEGAEWLFLRTMTRAVRNGRFDLEATILDADGDLVAVASHVNLALSAARNTAKRSGKL